VSDRVIELGLGRQPPNGLYVEALRRVIAQAVELLRDALAVSAEDDGNACCQELEKYLKAATDGTDTTLLEAGWAPCLDEGRRTIAEIRAKQQEGRRELTGLISMVREVVSAVGAENHGLHTSLNHALDRCETLGQFGDIWEIKSRLAAEVLAMRQVVAARHGAWEARVNELGERIAVLENELLTTRHEASVDPLTHVANRRAFDQVFREWTQAVGCGFVLAMIDVDGFKAINDTFGHAGGDRALVALAQTLKASVRCNDLVARVGGDEFALLVPDVTLRQAESRLRTLVASIAGTRFPPLDGRSPGLTVSCGVAEFSAGDTPASVTQRADEALYEAKRGGRNRVAVRARPFVSDLIKGR
jgi:diguanylate cyclase (GGDEF)-like protein